MSRIFTHTTNENVPTKIQETSAVVTVGDAQDIKDLGVGASNSKEPDFFELHAQFEIQYQQFITDTSDEITKRAQRLEELEAIVYGTS